MKELALNDLAELNDILKNNKFFSNGKNIKVKNLYATSAKSRWPYENLWGIYLAKPEYSWMALWMSVISRQKLKKRQIRYFMPEIDRGDYIGRIEIFNPDNLEFQDILCQEAYLYLFEAVKLQGIPLFDISGIKTDKKIQILEENGFNKKIIFKRGKNYETFIRDVNNPLIVNIDKWQIALTGVEYLVPHTELKLTESLIKQLAKRIKWSKDEVGKDYITKK